MCGLAGVIGPAFADEARIATALSRMRHRGPDASGIWRGKLGRHMLTLLHTRLSIIDLDARANQPFVRDDTVVALNGEIYNYRELRAELEKIGCTFTTQSDTEVFAAAWQVWGEAALDRLEGMYAAAIVDERAGCLWLTRDRFGEKPLFWSFDGRSLYFASEVKVIEALSGRRATPNVSQIRRYLVNGYKSLYKGHEGWFTDVHRFPPATVAKLEEASAPKTRRYWSLSYTPQRMDLAEAVAGTRDRLERAVRLQMRADVPLAFCLSGGIDSGLLISLAAQTLNTQMHSFSIVDSDQRYDESEAIAQTAERVGCKSHVIHTSRQHFLDRLKRQVAYHDAPVATISYYVHNMLSEAIARHGFKVAISGTGADELFTGYYDHYAFWLAENAIGPGGAGLLQEWHAGYGAHVRNPKLRDPMVFAANPQFRDHIYLDAERFSSLLRKPFFEPFSEQSYSDNTLRNRMLNELHHESVPVMLAEDDLDSMQYSVENRSPFLDRGLAEFAYRIPNRHLVGQGMAKWILRCAATGLLSDSVRLDARKRGFNASIDSLLDRKDASTRERLLADGPIFDVVDRERLSSLLDSDAGDNSVSKFLFSFVSARLFLDQRVSDGNGVSALMAETA